MCRGRWLSGEVRSLVQAPASTLQPARKGLRTRVQIAPNDRNEVAPTALVGAWACQAGGPSAHAVALAHAAAREITSKRRACMKDMFKASFPAETGPVEPVSILIIFCLLDSACICLPAFLIPSLKLYPAVQGIQGSQTGQKCADCLKNLSSFSESAGV